VIKALSNDLELVQKPCHRKDIEMSINLVGPEHGNSKWGKRTNK